MLDELCGEYSHSLDDRGRLAIPSKLRDLLGNDVVVTRGWDKCLYVYPVAAWKSRSVKIRDLPTSDREIRNLHRFFYPAAFPCEIDKQGRILLPVNLRTYAGIVDNVTIVGLGAYMEVWDTATWEAEQEKLLENAQVLAHALTERGREV